MKWILKKLLAFRSEVATLRIQDLSAI